MKSRTGLVLGAVLASSLAAAGCVSNSGLLVILQNNQPVQDTTTMLCSAGSTPSATAIGTGILDLETSSLPAAYPAYIAYPLVQSTLPIQAATPGAIEPNTVYIEGVRGTLIPPPGVTISWPSSDGSFTLQTNGNLATSSWVDYGGTMNSAGGTNSITVSPSASNLFFRLKSP